MASGFWAGFLERAGQKANEQNLLDIQQKVEKHKAFTEHMKKISEDPGYLPEAQRAAAQRWMEATQAGPMKFKNYDIGDILTVGTTTGVKPMGQPITYPGPPKEEGGPADYYNTFTAPARPIEGEPGIGGMRSGRYSPEELDEQEARAYFMKMQKQWEAQENLQRIKSANAGTKFIGGVIEMTDEDIAYAKAMGELPEDNIYYAPGLYAVRRMADGTYSILPKRESYTGAGKIAYNQATGRNQYTRINRDTGQTEWVDTPDDMQIFTPTTTKTVVIDGPSGAKQFYTYNTDSQGRPVLTNGAINLSPIAPPSSYGERTSSNIQWRKVGNAHEPFETTTSSQVAPPPETITFNSRGEATLNGFPIAILGKSTNTPTPASEPAFPLPPPFSSPVTGSPAAVTPVNTGNTNTSSTNIGSGGRPAAGTTSQEQIKARTTPVAYDSNKDPYLKSRPNLNKDVFVADLKALPSSVVANPNFIPNPVSYNPKAKGTLGIIPAKYSEQRTSTPSPGIHRPSGGRVVDTPKPLTEQQLLAAGQHENVFGTTISMLATLLEQGNLNILNSISNRARIIAACHEKDAVRGMASIIAKYDPTISEKDKATLINIAGVRRNLSEHIQVIRTPLGAAGFRSLEAFWALQQQYGDMYMHPAITAVIMRNTLRTVLTIRAAYRKSINISRQLQVNMDGKPIEGPNYPTADVINEYRIAYAKPDGAEDEQAYVQALLRDGYVAPPQMPPAL